MIHSFDRISHAFLEEALRDAGASNKSIAMIRALYAQTKAKRRVTAADGTQTYSKEFPINRGVRILQGDLISLQRYNEVKEYMDLEERAGEVWFIILFYVRIQLL